MTVGDPRFDLLLRSQLGHTNFSLIDRPPHAATTFALVAAEQIAGRAHRVAWVDDGSLTMRSYPVASDPSGGVAVVGARMIELTAVLRSLLIGGLPVNLVADEMERTLFDIIAEQAIRAGHPGRAVKALYKSVVGRRPGRDRPTPILNTTDAAMIEARMAVWCYGLLHEIGHLEYDPCTTHPATTDAVIVGRLRWLQENWLLQPVGAFVDPCVQATSQPTTSVVGVDVLRVELSADRFATGALFDATLRSAGEHFDLETFIREAEAALQVATVFYRLERCAELATMVEQGRDTHDLYDAALEPLVHSLASGVRSFAQKELVAEKLLSIDAGPGRPDPDVVEQLMWGLFALLKPLEETYQAVDQALETATTFLLSEVPTIDEHDAVAALTETLSRTSVFDADVERVTGLAEALGCATPATVALRRLVDDPQRRVSAEQTTARWK